MVELARPSADSPGPEWQSRKFLRLSPATEDAGTSFLLDITTLDYQSTETTLYTYHSYCILLKHNSIQHVELSIISIMAQARGRSYAR
jgi:hypothetical protein